nr:hypothetical protein [Gordonia paraffinivorans]
MGQPLLRLTEVDARVPAAAQLLDRADVDHAVVQVCVEFGHVAGDEVAVGGDRVTGKRDGAGRRHVLADVVEHHLLRLGQGDRRPAHLFGEPGVGVHLLDHVRHRGERLVVGVDDDVHAVTQDVQVTVGDQRRDLDQFVRFESQSGHLAIDPHQFVLHPTTLANAARHDRRGAEPVGTSRAIVST